SPPKPAPDGIHFLLERWQASRERSAMVGDFRFDLEAGRAAEVLTVHVSHPDAEQWPEITDHRFNSLTA
ncbi:MAG: HAD family hydrolase, partial [Gammaproteobacteria bacterium]